MKLKIPSKNDRIFSVEPRGIEPLYPIDNSGLLTRGGPSNSTNLTYGTAKQKERPSISSDFRDSIESAVVNLMLANQLLLSSGVNN